MEEIHEPAPDADAVLRMAAEGVEMAKEAAARVADDIAAGPFVLLGNLRGLAAALDAAMADPAAADRLSRAAYHLAGLLDAAGVFPAAAVAVAAEAVSSYACEPDTEG